MKSWRHTLFYSLLALGALAVSSPLAATPEATGTIHGDYARIGFTWPERVKFNASLSGRKLTVRFEKPAAPYLGDVLANLSPYVQKADIANGSKTIVFTLNGNYRIRSFISGNTSGVDILGIANLATTETAPSPTAEPVKTAEVKKKSPKEEKKTAKKEKPAKPQPPKKETAKETTPATSGADKTAEARPVSSAIPAVSTEKKAEAPAATTTEKQPISEMTSAKSAEAASTSKISIAATGVPVATAPAMAAGISNPNEPLKVIVDPHRESISLIFPWEEAVPALAFKRAGNIWIMFARARQLDLTSFADVTSDTVASLTPMEGAQNATLLRVATYGDAAVNMRKAESGLGWVVEIGKSYHTLPLPLTPKIITAGTSHVFIPVTGAATSLTITDPDIGDELTFIPLATQGTGIYPARQFVEFALPATAQGIVVQKKADHVNVTLQADGVAVSSEKGLTLSPHQLTALSPPPAGMTLFPYEEWRLPDGTDFVALRRDLAAPPSDSSDEANLRRLKLAQYYLGEGLAPEALGMLDDIRNASPEFFNSHKLAALRGAANFLLFRMNEAAEDFVSPELDAIPEIAFWRSVTDELLARGKPPFDFLAGDEKYLRHYPPPLREKLAIIAADSAIARKDYTTALAIFDRLSKDGQLASIQKYVDYMTAKIQADTGQQDAAVKTWEQMAQNVNDSFVRARAEYSLVGLLLQQGKITREEAITRLDRMRVVWRGDTLEMNLLELLGRLYNEKQDYINALRVMKEVVTNFPTSPEATELTQKMAEIFALLFNQGGGDNMQPLQALALYYEFRELTPVGAAGDEMIRNLADRLVSVDLLDNAAALLNHQVRFRLEKEERSRVGARLALIYLLNKQPQAALNALEMSAYGNNPEELNEARNQLAARALLDLGKQQDALALLQEDYQPGAQMLKLNVAWTKKDWPEVITLGESVLGKRKDLTAKLSDEEADVVTKLALAYVFTGDDVQLKYLHDYFGPLMQEGPNKNTFTFVTTTDGSVDYKDFEKVTQDIERMQSFIGGYESKVKKDGLSSAIN